MGKPGGISLGHDLRGAFFKHFGVPGKLDDSSFLDRFGPAGKERNITLIFMARKGGNRASDTLISNAINPINGK